MPRLFLFLRSRMGSGPEDIYITRNPRKMKSLAQEFQRLKRKPREAWDRDLMAEVIMLEHAREGWQLYQSLGINEDTSEKEVEEFLDLKEEPDALDSNSRD